MIRDTKIRIKSGKAVCMGERETYVGGFHGTLLCEYRAEHRYVVGPPGGDEPIRSFYVCPEHREELDKQIGDRKYNLLMVEEV